MTGSATASMETIQRLLAGTYSCEGEVLSVPTKKIFIADNLAGTEAELALSAGLAPPFAVVSDPDTHRAMAAKVEAALAATADIIPVRLEASPHADLETAERVARQCADARSVVAVGSGTVNDLCKFAAARNDMPCAVFATAPSMNGYTSVNAAITVAGHKKSLPAVAPVGVFMDLGVLAGAPARMIRAGLGDSLCRATAEADWLLSHLLFGTPFRKVPFDLLRLEEEDMIADSAALVAGSRPAVARLAQTLVLSGIGMTVCRGSYPASQGEHLIGHYIEMMATADWPAALHGEVIGVTTLVMARLQERILAGPTPVLRPSTITCGRLQAHFGPDLGAACWAEFGEKAPDAAGTDAINARLAREWPKIAGRLSAVGLAAADLKAALSRAGAPTSYADLGLDKDFFAEAILHAREIRGRYTFLDLAADSGQLNPEYLL